MTKARGNLARLPRGMRRRRRRSLVAALLTIGVALTGCGNATEADDVAAAPPEGPLESAAEECDAGRVADGGRTLIVDTEGEEDTSGESMADLVCLLVALDTPTAVIEHMSSTRALDGMQTNSWGQFDARWTYHPDAGMGLTITITD